MPEVEIDKSKTSESTNTLGKECVVGRFITEEEGWRIVKVAATWEGTPYSRIGANSVKSIKGDCSGTTNKIFVEAGFPYPYQSTASFETYVNASHRFREIDKTKIAMQAGDILFWPGHMAIYAPFPEGGPRRDTGLMKAGKKKLNNMFTAHNENSTRNYDAYNIETFRGDPYRVFRYLILPSAKDC